MSGIATVVAKKIESLASKQAVRIILIHVVTWVLLSILPWGTSHEQKRKEDCVLPREKCYQRMAGG